MIRTGTCLTTQVRKNCVKWGLLHSYKTNKHTYIILRYELIGSVYIWLLLKPRNPVKVNYHLVPGVVFIFYPASLENRGKREMILFYHLFLFLQHEQ